jgi:hypothetical protein
LTVFQNCEAAEKNEKLELEFESKSAALEDEFENMKM